MRNIQQSSRIPQTSKPMEQGETRRVQTENRVHNTKELMRQTKWERQAEN